MVTAFVYMTVKSGRENEWQRLVREIHRSTHTDDDGCLSFDVYRQLDAPREYVLHEQWRDADSLMGHIVRLQRVYGPPPEGYQLPAALLELLEQVRSVSYEVVA